MVNYHNLQTMDIESWKKNGSMHTMYNRILHEHRYMINRYVMLLRKDEYYSSKKGPFYKAVSAFIKRKRYNLGSRLGIFIPNGVFKGGLTIWHYGSVIVNANARVGKNCQLHGNNCIGNKGQGDLSAPILGDNVDIGYGAVIIGNVRIGNNVKIGANSVVNKSFCENNITIAGSPAKKIK